MSSQVLKTGVVNASGEIGTNLFKTTPKLTDIGSYNAYQVYLSENLTVDTTYTVQLWGVNVSHSAKSTADLGVDLYWGGGSLRMIYWHGSNYFTDGHADYLTGSFTVTSSQASHSTASNAWFNIYNSVGYVSGTMNLTIDKWKIERGTTPTAWNPNVADSEYVGNTCGFNEFNAAIAQITNGYVNAPDFIET